MWDLVSSTLKVFVLRPSESTAFLSCHLSCRKGCYVLCFPLYLRVIRLVGEFEAILQSYEISFS